MEDKLNNKERQEEQLIRTKNIALNQAIVFKWLINSLINAQTQEISSMMILRNRDVR
jgi:hypothetical protein